MTDFLMPTKVSVFLDALEAASATGRHRHGNHPDEAAPRAPSRRGRWAAIAMIPVALIAVALVL